MIRLPNNARCYSYIRFSSGEQEKGDSYRRQIEASRNFAKANGLIFDETLTIEDLGVSAYKGHNVTKGALGQFAKAVKDGKIKSDSVLIVESIDRISRSDVLTALNVFTGLIELGITIVTLQDNQIYSTKSIGDNWAQLIISITYMARAHEEIKIKTERVTEAWRNKASKLKPGEVYTSQIPMWLKVKNNKFIVIEDRGVIVKKIFDRYCSGYGYLLIAKQLNADGVLSFKGKQWGVTSVKKVLKNRAVVGCFTPKLKGFEFDEIEDYFPAIVSKEEFYKAQQITGSRMIGGQKSSGKSLGKRVNNLFSRIAHCGYCGSTMTFVSRGTTKVSSIHPDLSNNLTCQRYRRGIGCFNNSVQYNAFEINFLTFIHEIDIRSIFEPTVENDEVRALEGELVDKKKALVKIEEALEGEEALPKLYLRKTLELEKGIEALETAIELKSAEVNAEKAFSEQLSIYNYPKQLITTLQMTTTTLSEDDLYDIRLHVRQAIQQIVEEIKIYAIGYSGRNVDKQLREMGYSDDRVEAYYRELKSLKSKLQYIVHFRNGVTRHIMMGNDPNEVVFTADIDKDN